MATSYERDDDNFDGLLVQTVWMNGILLTAQDVHQAGDSQYVAPMFTIKEDVASQIGTTYFYCVACAEETHRCVDCGGRVHCATPRCIDCANAWYEKYYANPLLSGDSE